MSQTSNDVRADAPSDDPVSMVTGRPLTRRGLNTRNRLLDAGQHVIEVRGYAHATIAEIASTAEVALGTFYRYFDGKDDVCLSLLDVLFGEIRHSIRGGWNQEAPFVNIRESARSYLRAYAENRALVAALLQMSSNVPECAERWQVLRRVRFHELERYLARTPLNGVVDLRLAAEALGSMSEQFAIAKMVEGEHAPSDWDINQGAEIVAVLWHRAIFCSSPASYTGLSGGEGGRLDPTVSEALEI